LLKIDLKIPQDINNFKLLTANVTQATSATYTTKWFFDEAYNRLINPNAAFTFKSTGPYKSDISKLSVDLDNTFFELDKIYNFILQIISSQSGVNVIVTQNWNVTTNSPPKSNIIWLINIDGLIEATPPSGYRKTTSFVFDCTGWQDDIDSKNLVYKFYAIEENTGGLENIIQDWSSSNTCFKVFDVRYYQAVSTNIDVFCQVNDTMKANTTVSTRIVIYNDPQTGTFSITNALKNYKIANNTDLVRIYEQSMFLNSLSVDPFKDIVPASLEVKLIPSRIY
jgi:hypothetical protein